MNKKAFSLIEVLVSIALFSIILVFLYDTLDISTKSNQFYAQKLQISKNKNHTKEILFLDLINPTKSSSTFTISEDKNSNSIFSLESNNMYHNPFYSYVTYLLDNKKNLVRIESKTKFDKTKLDDAFFEKAYVDILSEKVKKLKIKKKASKYYFYIEYQDTNTMLFSF